MKQSNEKEVLFVYVSPENKKFVSELARKSGKGMSKFMDNLLSNKRKKKKQD